MCHRPEGLEQLQEQTRFSRKELQVLYRGFKNVSLCCPRAAPCARCPAGQTEAWGGADGGCALPQECPSGLVTEESFKQIYSQFFPQGGETRALAGRAGARAASDLDLHLHSSFAY